jgi:hypothetical protein
MPNELHSVAPDGGKPRTMLGDTVRRLRCDFCRTTPSSIWLVDYPIERSEHGGQIATWHVAIAATVHRTSYIPLRLMAAKRGARTMLRDVIRRLRCQLCKTVPSSIWLFDYPVENSEHGGQIAAWHRQLEQ